MVKEESLEWRSTTTLRKWWRGPKSFIVNSRYMEAIVCCRRTIVDIEEEVNNVVAAPKDEKGRLRLDLEEAKGVQVGGEATVPGL